jgi:acyl carrier protein
MNGDGMQRFGVGRTYLFDPKGRKVSPLEQSIKKHILSEYLKGEDPNELTETTALITSGILDSMAILRLELFLESEFSIPIDPRETTEANMDTIERIARFVRSKSTSIA